MGQLLNAIAEIMLFAVVVLAFATARVMHFIGIGEHPNLAAIAGAAAGIITVFIAPTSSVAAIIVTIAVTIASNFLFGKLSDKAEEKFGAKLDAKIAASGSKADNRDFEKILRSADSAERRKSLKLQMRYMSHNGVYYWNTEVAAELIYRAALENIESSGIKSDYPDAVVKQTDGSETYAVRFWFNKSNILLHISRKDGKTQVLLCFGKYDDADMKRAEYMQFEDRMVGAIDRLYLIIKTLMKELDPSAEAAFGK
jgi:hypothetical protein